MSDFFPNIISTRRSCASYVIGIKTTPIKNSYELMIDRLKAVISDKDAELARLKAKVESLKWWQGHGQKLRNAIFTHLMDLPGKSVFEVPTSDDDVEAQPEKTAKELARLKADYAICREEYAANGLREMRYEFSYECNR